MQLLQSIIILNITSSPLNLHQTLLSTEEEKKGDELKGYFFQNTN